VKSSVCIIFISILILSPTVEASFEEDHVMRKILTGITWDEEVGRIEAHYLAVMKYETEIERVVTDNDYIITLYGRELGKRDWTKESIEQYVRKHHFDGVYHSDNIFGKKVEIYKDLRNVELTDVDIERYIHELIEVVERDYNSPQPTSGKSYTIFGYSPFKIILTVLLVLFILFYLRRYNKF
jgi:hypothetical protein